MTTPEPRRGEGRSISRGAAALTFYLALVVFLTWPLGRHLTTHLPDTSIVCRFDGLLIAWALSHESRALASRPTHLADANIYFPARRALFYGEGGLGALPYFMPPFLATGNPALAINLTFVVSLALTAWALHLVVRRWTGSSPAGFVAAATYLATPWTVWTWMPGVPSYAVLQYFPLIVFMAAVPASRLAEALWLLPLIVLQGLASVYVAAAVLAPLVALGIGRLMRRRTRTAGLRLLAVVGLAALCLLACYSGYVLVRLENPSLRAQTPWPSPATSAPAFRFLTGVRGLFIPQLPTAVPMPALLVIALGAAIRLLRPTGEGAAPRAAWLHATLWAALGVLISLNPVAGERGTILAWPNVLVARLVPALYEVIRVPNRLGVAALVGLAILSGLGFAELTAKGRMTGGRRGVLAYGLALLLAGAMYLGFRLNPFWPPLPPVSMARPYPLARALGESDPLIGSLRKLEGPLVEVPGNMQYAPLHAAAMYRSIFHGRPLLNGYGSYWPSGFPERMALADRLPDPDALAELRRSTALTTVVVHTALLDEARRARWQALAAAGAQGGLRLFARHGQALVFVVDPVAGGPPSP